MATKPLWEEESDVALDEDIGQRGPAQIVVYNDDFNTFDFVILVLYAFWVTHHFSLNNSLC